ncbi:hypothetical protein GC169_01460 [bacterium]|nr:hypothetical protein [bacterium]
MSARPPTLSRMKRRIWLIAAGLVLGLAGLVAGARVWIGSPMGQAFVLSEIDGRTVPGVGMLAASGLRGDPLGRMTLDRLEVRDEDGAWLIATDIDVNWASAAALQRRIDISSMAAASVEVVRRPSSRPPTRGGSGRLPVSIKVADAQVNALHLAEGVAGGEATFRLKASGGALRSGERDLRATVSAIDGPDESISVDVRQLPGATFEANIRGSGPPRGVIATLLRAPDGASTDLKIDVGGPFETMRGDVRLAFGGADVIAITSRRSGDEIRGAGVVHLDRWPALDAVRERAGGKADVSFMLDVTRPEASEVRFDARASNAAVRTAMSVNLRSGALRGPVEVIAEIADASRLSETAAGPAVARGIIEPRSWSAWTARARVTLGGLAAGGSSITDVSGRVDLERQDRAIRFDFTEGRGDLRPPEPSAPTPLTINASGEYSLATGVIHVFRSAIEGEGVSVTARAEIAPRDGRVEGMGRIELDRLSAFAGARLGVDGGLKANWTARREGESGMALTVAGDATGLASGNPWVAELLAGRASVDMAGRYRGGNLALTAVNLQTPAVTASGDGVVGNGRIEAALRTKLRRAISVGSTKVAGGVVQIRASGAIASPSVTVAASGLSGEATGRLWSVRDARAKLAPDRRGGAVGDVTLSGSIDATPSTLRADLQLTEAGATFTGIRATIGRLSLASNRIAPAGGGWSGDVKIAGDIADLAGVDSGRIDLGGRFATGGGLDLDLSGEAREVARGALRLAAAKIDLNTDDGAIRVSADGQGEAEGPYRINVRGSAAPVQGGWAATAVVDGQWRDEPFRTTQPIDVSISNDGWRARASLAALGGSAEAMIERSGANAEATASITGLRARDLSELLGIEPLEGVASGRLDFSNPGRRAAGPAQDATARLSVQLAGLAPEGLPESGAEASFTAALDDGVVTVKAAGTGQGFIASFSGSGRVTVGEGFAATIDRSAPIEGAASISGRIDPLWAVFGPRGQVASGQFDATATIGGSVARPLLDGRWALSSGTFDHAQTGLHLEDVRVEGVFDGAAVRLVSATAADGRGGAATAQGELTWGGGPEGVVKINTTRLRALTGGRLEAVVSGPVELVRTRTAYRLSGTLQIDDAFASVEQPQSERIPVLPGLRRVNFGEGATQRAAAPPPRPLALDLKVRAPRRLMVRGRGLDMEWSGDVMVTGTTAAPLLSGAATLVRGDLTLAGRRFMLDSGTVRFNGPPAASRVDVRASRESGEFDLRVRVEGSIADPTFTLESTPALPEDEILSRVLFGRSAAQLSAFQAAQLAASLAQLAGGQAVFDPVGLLRDATGLDTITVEQDATGARVAAGEYIAEDVYLEVGAGSEGGAAAKVEWEPSKGVSVVSEARSNGDTRIAVRWKRTY